MAIIFDVVILGGSLSDASPALLLRRKQPDLRVLKIEKSMTFERNLGEARAR